MIINVRIHFNLFYFRSTFLNKLRLNENYIFEIIESKFPGSGWWWWLYSFNSLAFAGISTRWANLINPIPPATRGLFVYALSGLLTDWCQVTIDSPHYVITLLHPMMEGLQTLDDFNFIMAIKVMLLHNELFSSNNNFIKVLIFVVVDNCTLWKLSKLVQNFFGFN